MTGQRPPSAWELVTLGSTLAGAVIVGLGVGLLLDVKFDSGPLWTLIGLAVGVILGGYAFWLRIRTFLKS